MAEREKSDPKSLSALLEGERTRILDGLGEERLAQMKAAERQKSVFAAWNAVCASTREGSHVTGLYYAAPSNELVVYLDGAAWTQEMTMMREIIRARMSIQGVDVDNIVFKTSKEGYGKARPPKASQSAGKPSKEVRRAEVSDEERAQAAAAVDGIADEKLKRAVEKAMIASLELSKSEKM